MPIRFFFDIYPVSNIQLSKLEKLTISKSQVVWSPLSLFYFLLQPLFGDPG